MNRYSYVFIGLAVLLLSGCAAVTPTSLPLAPDDRAAEAKQFIAIADKAVLYLYRDEFMGSQWQIPVAINGKYLGKTGGYTFFRIALEPGQYIIESNAENHSRLPVTMEAGKLYYVWQETKTGIKAIRTELQLVDEKTGQAGVKKSRLLQVP